MTRSLLDAVRPDPEREDVEVLVDTPSVRIERIVSFGHVSPEGFWYDQPEAEFVLVLAGVGRILFEDGAEVEMAPGDSLLVEPHQRHRVSYTTPEAPTVWLAVHYRTP